MTTNRFNRFILWLTAALLSAGLMAQTTTLTYQGQLRENGQPFTGTANLEFRLFDQLIGGSEVAGPQTRLNWPVEDGLFQVGLDFGAAFDGSDRYLEIRVNGAPLNPRQPVTATPYALLAAATADGAVGGSAIDPTQVQRRVDGACSAGQSIRVINENGSVTCESHNEIDPQVGTVVDGRWCVGSGSQVTCTQAPPVTIEMDPQVSSVTNNQWCRGDGSAVTCDQAPPAASSQTCASGRVTGIDGSGGLICSPRVAFLARRNSVYFWPVNAAVQAVKFDMEVYDDSGDFNPAIGEFTAPVSGLYTFHAVADIRGVSAGDAIYIYIKAGGNNYNGTGGSAAGGSTNRLLASTTVYLTAGQKAQMRGYINASSPPGQMYGNAATSFMFTWFQGALIE